MEKFINYYNSPLGKIALSSDCITKVRWTQWRNIREYLTGLWFVIFDEAKKWLDIYFTGQNPSFIPKYKFENLTPFKKRVFDILNEISYGKVITYNDIVQKYV